MSEQVKTVESQEEATSLQAPVEASETKSDPFATIAEVLAAAEAEQSENLNEEWQQRMEQVQEDMFSHFSEDQPAQEPPTITSMAPIDELVDAEMEVEAPIIAAAPPAPEKKEPFPAQDLTDEQKEIKERVIQAIQTVFDPEIPVDIYQLGLIYDVLFDADNNIRVLMTLTSPACPEAQTLPAEVELVSKRVEGVNSSQVELVWDPPWDPSMMSEEAQLHLGFF